MTWLPLAVLSALFLGLYDVAKKAALDGNAVLPVLFGCSLAGAALVLPAGIASWTAPGLAAQAGILVEPLTATGHLLVMAKACIVTTSWVLTYFAIKHLPISIASPLRASAPLFVVLGAVAAMGERPTGHQWLGIAVMLCAYWAFSALGREEGIHFTRNRWVGLLLLGTLVGAASGLYDKHLLQSARLPPMAVQFWFALYGAALQGLLVAVAWWPRRRAGTPFQWRWSIVAVGALLLVADAFYFRAVAAPLALISVVSLTRRSNVVVSFAVGGLAFREKNRLKKAGALAGLVVGVGLLLG
ncbi:MAG TPA: DMT family transporter [Myxococcales bacterium]|jgi:drug/metabolite transporter (DMT)-like permease